MLKKKRVSSVILILLAVFFTFFSCAGGKFVPFQNMPDVCTFDDYYPETYANSKVYNSIFMYKMVKYLEETSIETDEENLLINNEENDEIKTGQEYYEKYKSEKPEMIKRIDEEFDQYAKMILDFTWKNRIKRFESMKDVIDKYITYVYLPDGELNEEGFNGLLSPEIAEYDPAGKTQAYLKDNDIHIKEIAFDEIFYKFDHYLYPFLITYKYTIYYYVGDTEPPENKLLNKKASMLYSLGVNDIGDYIICYVYDSSK